MNVLQYSAAADSQWKDGIRENNGYEPQYTFFGDFSIAEFFECRTKDKGAIRDTFNRVIESWGGNYKAMSEVALCLNHKIWFFYYGSGNSVLGITQDKSQELAKLYEDLWHEAEDKFFEKFTGNDEAVAHYYQVND